MQTVRFLHAALAQALRSVHARRLTALMCTVAALLHGRRLTLTGLGRAMPGTAYPKHAIKRVDRLLGNPHLQAERPLFYWVMLRAV
ncbi:MAG: IS4 family transposase, partial [Pseudomonas sp.]